MFQEAMNGSGGLKPEDIHLQISKVDYQDNGNYSAIQDCERMVVQSRRWGMVGEITYKGTVIPFTGGYAVADDPYWTSCAYIENVKQGDAFVLTGQMTLIYMDFVK